MNTPEPVYRTTEPDDVFDARLASIEAAPPVDIAADVRERAESLLSRTRAHMAWRGSRGGSLLTEDFAFLAGWDAARAAIAADPGPDTADPARDESGRTGQAVVFFDVEQA